MGTEQVLEKLQKHRDRLAELGVVSLSVFGSVARGESRPESDVDLLVDFDGPATFDRYIELKFLLEDVLNRRVDLLTRPGIRPELRSFIEQDARRARAATVMERPPKLLLDQCRKSEPNPFLWLT